MDRYGIIKAIPMSFYSKKLYQDVAQNWGGKAFLYLLFVLALTLIIPTYQAQDNFNTFYKVSSEKIIPQIPVMTVADGKISTPEVKPYRVIDPASKQILMVIDTSGQIDTIEAAQAYVLITSDKVIYKRNANEKRTYEIPKTLNATIDASNASRLVDGYLQFLWIPIFLIMLVFSFFYRFFQAMVYGLLGKIFSWITGSGLNYMQIIQIGMVSITPVLVVCSVENFFDINVPNSNWYYFGLAILYLFYGIVVNKNPKDKNVVDAPKDDEQVS